ncbi:MAG: hypothetical protein ACP5RS_00030 [Thermoplasmata archaeon]
MERNYYTVHEVKAMLEKDAQNGTLSQIGKETLEYLQKVSTISEKDAKELVETFVNDFRYDEKLAVKLVDIMPMYPEEVRAVFSKIKDDYDQKEIQKVIDTIKKYL